MNFPASDLPPPSGRPFPTDAPPRIPGRVMKAKALIDECASGGLQAVKPVVGVTFGVGDCENPDFGREIKKHKCIRKSRK